MRILARILRQFRSNLRNIREYHSVSLVGRRYLVEKGLRYTCPAIHNARADRSSPPSFMISRALSDDAVQNSTEEGNDEKGGPLVEYERRIAAGELMDGDLCQLGTLRELQRLYDQLVEKAIECRLDRYAASEKAGRPCTWRKKRIHFHDFMLTVHSRLQRHKGVNDPLEVVAGEISDEAILLCLDEFMVLVSTSNRAPDNLYEGGLQRDLFLPFISTVKERCIVREIGSSVDYRKMTSGEQGFYLIGLDLSGVLKATFQKLVGEHKAYAQEVEVVMGRKLQVPMGANGCAYFHFEDLCDKPLGAADYFGLFKKFHTLALDGIPIFGLHNRTAAYRFVTLIDVMYENKGRLLCTAEGSPYELFGRIVTVSEAKQIAPRTSSRSRKNDIPDLCVDNELGFAKDRTISRLTEINSKEYQEQHATMLAVNQRKQGSASGNAM